MKEKWNNIPNLLSFFRLLMIPVFIAVFFADIKGAWYWAAGIFLLASATDILDGYIARKYNQITRLGRVMDPLADKLMKAAAAVCLTIEAVIPLWVFVVLAAKELIMLSGGAVMLKKTKDVPSSNMLGKSAEFYICALCVASLLFSITEGWSLLLWSIALAAELAAMCVYAVKAIKIVKTERGNK